MMIIQSLIEEVADAKDKEPDELGLVLEDYIPTEAIQHLEEHESESWTLQFELPDHTVQIAGDGTILVNCTPKQTPA